MGQPWAAGSADGAPARLPLVLTALWAAAVGLELAYVLVLGPGPPPLGPLARALQLALAAFQLLNLLGNVGLFLRSDPSIRGVMLAGRGLGQGWLLLPVPKPGAATQRTLLCLPRLHPASGPPLPTAGPLRGLRQLPAVPVPAASCRRRPAPHLRAAGTCTVGPAASPHAPPHGCPPPASLAHAAHRQSVSCHSSDHHKEEQPRAPEGRPHIPPESSVSTLDIVHVSPAA
ncbi:PREDICTED: probable palmitoyltransferase ZDHHC24 isoform X4 [Cercocebus atys]|uniref:probable palmitoyltransferase ZDHHC24 isoform X4 n=1 Tax=Cercocebus atys TaxID=9531 RepID=UPI0005F386A7|nr:PREDICTED: probable palmitoyltransferase ZDHHC24 isoform X4 [Cercocebus atys]